MDDSWGQYRGSRHHGVGSHITHHHQKNLTKKNSTKNGPPPLGHYSLHQSFKIHHKHSKTPKLLNPCSLLGNQTDQRSLAQKRFLFFIVVLAPLSLHSPSNSHSSSFFFFLTLPENYSNDSRLSKAQCSVVFEWSTAIFSIHRCLSPFPPVSPFPSPFLLFSL